MNKIKFIILTFTVTIVFNIQTLSVFAGIDNEYGNYIPYSYNYKTYQELQLPLFEDMTFASLPFVQNYFTLSVFFERTNQWMDYLKFIAFVDPKITKLSIDDNVKPGDIVNIVQNAYLHWRQNDLAELLNNNEILDSKKLSNILDSFFNKVYINNQSLRNLSTDNYYGLMLQNMQKFFLFNFRTFKKFPNGFFVSFKNDQEEFKYRGLEGIPDGAYMTPFQRLIAFNLYNIRFWATENIDEDTLSNSGVLWYPILCLNDPKKTGEWDNYGIILASYIPKWGIFRELVSNPYPGSTTIQVGPLIEQMWNPWSKDLASRPLNEVTGGGAWVWYCPDGYIKTSSTKKSTDFYEDLPFVKYSEIEKVKDDDEDKNWLFIKDSSNLTFNYFGCGFLYQDQTYAAALLEDYPPGNFSNFIYPQEKSKQFPKITKSTKYGYSMFRTDNETVMKDTQEKLNNMWAKYKNSHVLPYHYQLVTIKALSDFNPKIIHVCTDWLWKDKGQMKNLDEVCINLHPKYYADKTYTLKLKLKDPNSIWSIGGQGEKLDVISNQLVVE